jgi:hypothetical protein
VFGRRPTFDRLSNRRFGTVLFDPHDEYFILPTKATELAAISLSRALRPPGDACCEKSPSGREQNPSRSSVKGIETDVGPLH